MNDTLTNQILANTLAATVRETFKKGGRFIGIVYTNENGETARHNLLTGVNLTSLYKSDLRTLLTLRPTLTGIDAVACDELIVSVRNSLDKGIGNNDNYTLKGYYEPVTENKEVSLHTENGVTHLYLRGYVIKKTVIKEGEYKVVKSSEKTLAKKKIEKTLKRSKIRTFKINLASLKSVRLNGMTVELS
jgi:hypothetical protein